MQRIRLTLEIEQLHPTGSYIVGLFPEGSPVSYFQIEATTLEDAMRQIATAGIWRVVDNALRHPDA